MNFKRVKKNYDNGLWSIKMVKDAVDCNIITKDEFFVITNKKYEEVE